MPLSAINGNLLTNADTLAICPDRFVCGVDSLDITISGIANSSCSTCTNYNDTVTVIPTTVYQASICGYVLSGACIGQGVLYNGFDFCYNFGHILGTSLFVYFGRTSSGYYHAFVVLAKGGEGPYERWLVWHKESTEQIPYDTSFSSSDIMQPCINYTNPYGYCDISHATATLTIL